MFLANAMKGTLIKRNRESSTSVYDDEVIKEVPVKLCPYNQDIRYTVKSNVDIKEGDQITFMGKTYSVIKVKDNWIWNRIENYTVALR